MNEADARTHEFLIWEYAVDMVKRAQALWHLSKTA